MSQTGWDDLLGEWNSAEADQAMQREADRTREVTIHSFMSTAPTWLKYALQEMGRFHQIEWGHDSDNLPTDVPADRRKPARLFAEAEVVSSRVRPIDDVDEHYLILDVDAGVVALPSSTPGHSHLIFNTSFDTEALHEILDVLAKHGVIERNYAEVSKHRPEGAFLRLPWIRKGKEKWDAIAALNWWVAAEEDEIAKVLGSEPKGPW